MLGSATHPPRAASNPAGRHPAIAHRIIGSIDLRNIAAASALAVDRCAKVYAPFPGSDVQQPFGGHGLHHLYHVHARAGSPIERYFFP
jgi:hypothetical protein